MAYRLQSLMPTELQKVAGSVTWSYTLASRDTAYPGKLISLALIQVIGLFHHPALVSVLKLHACSFVGLTIEFIVNIIYSDTPLFLSHGISEITPSILMALVVPQLLVI